jgi:translation initiation factor 1
MASSKKRREGGLVWDSEVGSVCPGCGQRVAACTCRAGSSTPAAGDGIVRVALDRKGRNGKVVTVIRGVPASAEELVALSKELKKRCGAGGKAADGCIEIQGDCRDALVAELQKRGFVVKRSGG